MQQNSKKLKKRSIVLLGVWAVLIALDIAGLIWNIVRFQAGTLDGGGFSYALLHFFVSIGTISAIYIAEFVFRFRAGAPLVVCCALFAFFGNTVSNVWHMYDYFPRWDMVLHSLSGVLFAAVGLGLASLFMKDQPEGTRKVLACVLFTLFFSLAVGYLWEIFEFTVDSIDPSSSTQGWSDGMIQMGADGAYDIPDGTYLVNSRRGTAILDTMEDMILHLCGTLVLLVPLFILFLKKPARMRTFAFTPAPRKTKAPMPGQDADVQDAHGEPEKHDEPEK